MSYTQDSNMVKWNKTALSTVEVAFEWREVWVRNTEDPNNILIFTRSEWEAFIEGVKLGEFDI